jgi:hypothetical protein
LALCVPWLACLVQFLVLQLGGTGKRKAPRRKKGLFERNMLDVSVAPNMYKVSHSRPVSASLGSAYMTASSASAVERSVPKSDMAMNLSRVVVTILAKWMLCGSR